MAAADGGGPQQLTLEPVSGGRALAAERRRGHGAASMPVPNPACFCLLQQHELRMEVDWGKQVHLQVRQ